MFFWACVLQICIAGLPRIIVLWSLGHSRVIIFKAGFKIVSICVQVSVLQSFLVTDGIERVEEK